MLRGPKRPAVVSVAEMFDAVVERFVAQGPLTVMGQLVLERACEPSWVDAIFKAHSERQYEHQLLYSTVVELMSLVALGRHPSLHAAAQKQGVPVSLQALYKKVNRSEPAVLRALVRGSFARLAPLFDALHNPRAPVCEGMTVRIVDGNHLPASEKRLKPLRGFRGAAMPGQSLVVYDPDRDLVVDVLPAFDAHDSERTLLAELLPSVQAGELWIADRAFSTRATLAGFAERGAYLLVREHSCNPAPTEQGPRRKVERLESGALFEQSVTIATDSQAPLRLRRIELELDAPTASGHTVIRLLTNVPAHLLSATTLAQLYRTRWRIEGLFGRLESVLTSEVRTLGTPGAALLAFCTATMAYNVLAMLQATVEAAHPICQQVPISTFYIANDLRAEFHLLNRLVPPDYWTKYSRLTIQQLATTLLQIAKHVVPAQLRKHPRKPKPKANKGYAPAAQVRQQVATARVLQAGTVNYPKK